MFFEQDSAIKLDAVEMADNAKEEVDVQNDDFNNDNDEEDTDQNLIQYIRFIDEIGSDNTQASASWEGTKPNATVTLSG